MRLDRITLRNFRGITESAVEFGPGVTVVAGPNEVGKSSIAEAIRLLRTTKHSSSAQPIRALKPVGKDAGPEVELEFTTGGHEVWVRKRWLRQPLTELRITGARSEQLSGDPAHERLTTLLGETMDTDLFDALEVLQGKSLETAKLVGLRSLSQALDTSSAPVADHDELLERIGAEYDRLLTGTGRPRAEYKGAIEHQAELSQQVEQLREKSREMDQLTEEARRAGEQLLEDEADLALATEKLEQSTANDTALNGLREAVSAATAATVAARARVADAETAHQARTELIEEADQRARTLSEAAEKANEHEEALTTAQLGSEAASDTLTAAQAGHDEARARNTQAARALERARNEEEFDQLHRRLEEAHAAEGRRLEATERIASSPVDAALLERITTLATDVQVAARSQEAAAAQVVIAPLGHEQILLNDSEVSERTELVATEAVSIGVPGVAQIDIRPGAMPGELADTLRAAREELDAALREGEVESAAAAREVAARREDATSELLLAQHALGAALGQDTFDELKEQHAVLKARLAADGDESPAGGPVEPDPAAAPAPGTLADLREREERTRADALAAEVELTTARDAAHTRSAGVSRLREEHIRTEAAAENQRAELTRTTEKLARLRSERTDEELAGELAAAAGAERAADEQVHQAELALTGANPGAVEMELNNAAEWNESASKRVEASGLRLREFTVRLEDRAAEGIYDALTNAEAELDAAEGRLASLQRRAEAAALLSRVMTAHQSAAHARYVAPFARSIERLGKVVFGPDFAVEISPELTITSRTLDGQTVPFDSLSAGAKEQLGLLGRLACAELVDPREGAPVILDDTLGFADNQRLEALSTVLNDVGKAAQIILLTCQPSRFSRVGGAEVVHLSSV